MYVYKATTNTSAPVATMIGGGRSCDLYGVIASYAESATYYVKFWYQGNTNVTPIVGTTVPSLTVPISSGGPGFVVSPQPIIMQGPVYWAATANASDTDATALTTGGEIVNILLG